MIQLCGDKIRYCRHFTCHKLFLTSAELWPCRALVIYFFNCGGEYVWRGVAGAKEEVDMLVGQADHGLANRVF